MILVITLSENGCCSRGFSTETSAAEAWNLLFPDDAEDEDANGAEDLHSEVSEGMLSSMYRTLTILACQILFGNRWGRRAFFSLRF